MCFFHGKLSVYERMMTQKTGFNRRASHSQQGDRNDRRLGECPAYYSQR